ncbi:uncharacterized protein TNCV_1600151 [Trichonephila clavipes]|nr:uncharacterized protein TNCV_1600151 [Trichonephila clavipes]
MEVSGSALIPPTLLGRQDGKGATSGGGQSSFGRLCPSSRSVLPNVLVAAVAEWYRYRIVACLVTSSSPVPLKTYRVRQRCTLSLSSAETSSRWYGVVVRREGASSGVVHVT